MRRPAASILLFLCVSAALAQESGAMIEIRGTVTSNGRPVRDVGVELQEGKRSVLPWELLDETSWVPFAHGVTDAQGRYVFHVDRKKAVLVSVHRNPGMWGGWRVPISRKALRDDSVADVDVDLPSDVLDGRH